MASTLSSTQAHRRFDAEGAPMAAKDHFTAVEEALATLVRTTFMPDAPVGGPASDRSADAGISQSFATATLGPADPQGGADPVREQRSLGKRSAIARVTIATITVGLAVSAICAWRWYGDHSTV